MAPAGLTFSVLMLAMLCSGVARADCDRRYDPDCDRYRVQRDDRANDRQIEPDILDDNAKVVEPGGGGGREAPVLIPDGRTEPSASAGDARPLQPVRAYLSAAEIPPPDVGAYGLVVFHSRPTSASRQKLLMVCKSFVAFFPRSERSSVQPSDQMVTIWPVEQPSSPETRRDDCDYAIDNYDLVAAEAAITDATRQHGNFNGDGPFLVGWSPSRARGLPDALVLVIDMSSDITQDEIDHQFLFWKNEIVQDPSKWRGGWSLERIRLALKGYADTYGPAIMDSVKLFTGKPP